MLPQKYLDQYAEGNFIRWNMHETPHLGILIIDTDNKLRPFTPDRRGKFHEVPRGHFDDELTTKDKELVSFSRGLAMFATYRQSIWKEYVKSYEEGKRSIEKLALDAVYLHDFTQKMRKIQEVLQVESFRDEEEEKDFKDLRRLIFDDKGKPWQQYKPETSIFLYRTHDKELEFFQTSEPTLFYLKAQRELIKQKKDGLRTDLFVGVPMQENPYIAQELERLYSNSFL
ncbi:MAG: hypothetical protein KC535_03635 [Nanoarchaeota archaeon]|nr:hypothetical protein [Nanoarchaeota archaeon]